MTQPALEMRDVIKDYEGSRGHMRALDGFSLSLHPGASAAILGPSGCGKSTALRIASGLISATSGTVLADGEPVTGPRLTTSLILQDFGLLPWKTVEQNAGLGLQIRHMGKAERRERVAAALAQVGLSDFASSYPSELSGGMRQRLAMARALTCDTELLLMDEPLSALDALLREEMQVMLRSTWLRAGYAQVIVTHSVEEAVYLGQRILVLSPRPGRVVFQMDNPEMLDDDWRSNPLFFERCSVLRDVLHGNVPSGAADAEAVSTPDAGQEVCHA